MSSAIREVFAACTIIKDSKKATERKVCVPFLLCRSTKPIQYFLRRGHTTTSLPTLCTPRAIPTTVFHLHVHPHAHTHTYTHTNSRTRTRTTCTQDALAKLRTLLEVSKVVQQIDECSIAEMREEDSGKQGTNFSYRSHHMHTCRTQR